MEEEKAPVAQDIDAVSRTEDVQIKRVSPFSKMLLSDAVRKGLHQASFIYPTVIQATAIPLGKSGMDLLVQSKSGTGKTLIFCTILLETYSSKIREPQALIVVPTREIAVQIELVLNKIGRFCQGFRAVSVIGGMEVAEDRKRLQGAKAVVGTPGRLLHLIHNEVLNTSCMNLLVLDEADKMYTQSFRQDLQRIQRALPSKRQTIACSATFCDGLDEEIAKIMRKPLLVSTEQRATLLVGIKQFAIELPEEKTSILEMEAKLDALQDIFRRIAFKQCLIFAGTQLRADSYRNYLQQRGWPCELITGAQDQKTRLEMFHKFREFKTRILIATDLMSRGVDSEHVNLVINLELPNDVVTYLHRIGRAGRFGSHGIAINFIVSEKDRLLFGRLVNEVGNGMQVLKFPNGNEKVSEERDIWDFSDFSLDIKHFGCFNTGQLAPLASGEHDSSSDLANNNKVDIPNSQQNGCDSNSSIDTKTFEVDSDGVVLSDLPAIHMPGQKSTSESRQGSSQQLPSSNTIDDASSIAADSVLSSQPDASKYQSILMQKMAIPTLVEFLVDQKSEQTNGEGLKTTKGKEKIDLFEDYERTVEEQETDSSFNASTDIDVSNLKLLLIDQPSSKKSSEPNNHRDIYSDYANFDADEVSSSAATGTVETDSIDKGTFILSVETPSQARDSMEELQNTSLNSSQICSISEIQSLPEVKHFTSPVQNKSIPDVVPPSSSYGNNQKLMVTVGSQVEISSEKSSISPTNTLKDWSMITHAPSPLPVSSVSQLSKGANSSFRGSCSTSNTVSGRGGSSGYSCGAGGSSGFDERPTASCSGNSSTVEKASGVKETNEEYSTNSEEEEHDDSEAGEEEAADEQSDIENNVYSYEESSSDNDNNDEEIEYDGYDEENECSYAESDDYEDTNNCSSERRSDSKDNKSKNEEIKNSGKSISPEEKKRTSGFEQNDKGDNDNDDDQDTEDGDDEENYFESDDNETDGGNHKVMGVNKYENLQEKNVPKKLPKKPSLNKINIPPHRTDTNTPYDVYDEKYAEAYKRWSEIYWQQLKLIQLYVKFSKQVRQQHQKQQQHKKKRLSTLESQQHKEDDQQENMKKDRQRRQQQSHSLHE